MKLYLRLIGNSYQQNMAYKSNVIMGMVGKIISMFIQISVWFALYGGSALVNSNKGAITIHEMITYVLVSTGISMFINNQVIGMIDGKIKSGMIAMDLIKPINFHANILCNTLGNNLFHITFQLAPLVFISFFIYHISLPSTVYIFLFFISLLNAFVLFFIISYILGLIGFWYLSVWHFSRLLEDVVRLFGGVWIPLWFFPKTLIVISQYLPFQYIYFVPINIFLEKLTIEESMNMLLIQVIWILLFIGLSYFVWIKGKQKLVIQGG